MLRVAISLFLAILLISLTARAGADTNQAKPGPVEEQFLELREEYQKAVKAVDGNDDQKRKIAAAFAPRFLALALKKPKDEAAPDPLLWILINAPQSAELPRAAKMLENQHLQSPRLKPKLQAIHAAVPETERFLRAVMTRGDDRETQGIACYALAQLLKDRAGDDHPKVRQEAVDLFDRCATKFADCPLGSKGPTLGERCKPILFEMRRLAIGKVVPDIVGTDVDGKEFKLSDYRGKVTVLSYWATWCPACMKMVPHEQALVQRFEGMPFVLIGVNGDPAGEKKKVKLRMEKEQITWRSFWNGEPTAAKWNVEYWPTIFVIDHTGVIRHRFGLVDSGELDRAIDPLVAAAKKAPDQKAADKKAR